VSEAAIKIDAAASAAFTNWNVAAARVRRRTGAVTVAAITAMAAALGIPASPAHAQAQVVDLTLERMVELGLRDSYRVRQLELEVDRTRSLLRAEQAGLKSRVEMVLSAPEFQSISDYKWNSDLQRNELIHENTRRWQMDLSVRQPVILFGFPTNGYLSLNNRVYRYTQLDDEERDIRYYNRYFIGYDQPLFQPNRMRHSLEEAQLNLERSELDYGGDVVGMVDDLAGDYYELLEAAYDRVIAAEHVADLETASDAAQQVVQSSPSRNIELDQLQVELVNAREEWQRARSSFRLQSENIKQRLRLGAMDSIALDPSLDVEPIEVDAARAIELATTLAPRLRRLAINRRQSEIGLERTRGNNSFRMNVRLTYGREVQDPRFENIWTEPRNSYTVNVNATIPIWDWGERKHRIQASRYSIERNDLSIEEARSQIATSVLNEVRNLEEYQQRALNMQGNLEFARQITASTIERYGAGEITLVDVLQTIDREANTARNFLDAYLGYRRALLRLQEITYYDFEHDVPILERFGISTPATPE